MNPEQAWNALQQIIGPFKDWKGNCFAVATAMAKLLGSNAHAVYGHYLGVISSQSIFAEKIPAGFCPHGWVQIYLDDQITIVDPTRWVLLDVEPYLFVQDFPCDDYDEGGQQFRSILQPAEPPEPNIGEKSWTLCTLSDDLSQIVLQYLGDTYQGTQIYMMQWHWLVHLPYEYFSPHVRELYEAMESFGLKALIPIDNWRRMEREYPKE